MDDDDRYFCLVCAVRAEADARAMTAVLAERERDAARAEVARIQDGEAVRYWRERAERAERREAARVDAGVALDLPDGETWDRTRAALGRAVALLVSLRDAYQGGALSPIADHACRACIPNSDDGYGGASQDWRCPRHSVAAVLADPEGVAALAYVKALEAVAEAARENAAAHEEESFAAGCGGKCGCDLCAALAALEQARRGKGD